MEENVLNNNSVSSPEVDTETNYIQALNELKQNSVSKADYNKLKEENKQLIETLISNGQMENPVEEIPVDIEGLRGEMFGRRPKDMNNLEYITKAVALREAILDKEGVDIFLPNGRSYNPNIEDMQASERVIEAFKHCIEYADGDSEVFTNELMRITRDAAPMNVRKRM